VDLPLSMALPMSYKFDMLYFHSVQCIFKFSLRLPLTYVLFISSLFSSQMLKDFLLSFCYWLIIWLCCLVWFKFFLKGEFVFWPRKCSTLGYAPWALEENVYSAVVGHLYEYWLDSVGWWHYWVLYPSYFLFSCLSVVERDLEVSGYNYVFVYFSFQLLIFASLIL
jgi:hypothetical protein